MTLRSKILKTKKRLSDDSWLIPACVIAAMGLMFAMTFAMRSVSLSGRYGVVGVEIPVMSVTVDDPAHHTFREVPYETLRDSTPAVVITTDGFYFGDLEAFTVGYTRVTNKYIVPTEAGRHRVDRLLDDMEKWLSYRKERHSQRTQGMVVLVPSGDIPANIVIQVIAGLKQSEYFDRVVLGSGMI